VTAFQTADIGSVKSRSVSEVFLRDSQLGARLAHAFPKEPLHIWLLRAIDGCHEPDQMVDDD
jgi:hypothetical protein